MKAAVIRAFGPPEVLRIEDIPTPEPKADEVRVRVHAASVNRVLDVAVRRGDEQHRGITLPLIPGVDCAGVIEAVGAAVTDWTAGTAVVAAGKVAVNGRDDRVHQESLGIHRPGTFAEYVCVPASALHRIPAGLTFAAATVAMRHLPTAWNLMVNTAALKAGEWVMVMGASGNLGSLGIQIAKHIVGANVIAVAGSRERANAGLAYGADIVVDYSTENLLEVALKATGGAGINVLYDNIANPKVLPQGFAALGRHGRLVTAGAHGGPKVSIDFAHLYQNRITIKGLPGYDDRDVAPCLAAVAGGAVSVNISRYFPLSELAQAHRLVEEERDVGKIVIDVFEADSVSSPSR